MIQLGALSIGDKVLLVCMPDFPRYNESDGRRGGGVRGPCRTTVIPRK